MKKLLLGLVGAVLLVGPASALDLTQRFRDTDKSFITEPNVKPGNKEKCDGRDGGPCMTLGSVIFQSLLATYNDEPGITGEEKFNRGRLAQKIQDQKAVDLTAEEVVLVKKLVGKLYTPIIVVQAYGMLDPAAAPAPAK